MNKIIRQIGTISRALDTIANIEFRDLEVSKGQYVHLVRIYENLGITLRQLSKITYIDETTCSRSVNKLEKNGLIYKSIKKENKKNKMLYLTEHGEDVVAVILNEHKYTNNIIANELTKEEIKLLFTLLEKVENTVTKDFDYVRKYGKREYDEYN